MVSILGCNKYLQNISCSLAVQPSSFSSRSFSNSQRVAPLTAAPSQVNHPFWGCKNKVRVMFSTSIATYFPSNLIPIYSVNQNISHILTSVSPLDGLESELVSFQLPVHGTIFWGIDVMSCNREIWIPRLGGPCIKCEGNFRNKTLFKKRKSGNRIYITVNIHHTPNLSHTFSSANWARQRTSPLIVFCFGISLSRSPGQQ